MDKTLRLYTYIDGVNDTPFPSAENHAILTSFQYDSKRMGGAPTISATLMHHECLDRMWKYNVYAQFNGEKYFIKQIPSSQHSNTDILYKHDVELVSERVILDNVYFYDVVSSDAENDKPVSNSTKFTFFGDIHEFAKRLNYSLQYRKVGYSVVVDEGISSEGKLVSFEDTVFSNAIQESYNTYEIPYYFVGKVIHFGFTNNAITNVFKYGADESLLSIQKSNANYKVVTRITGTGSSDNIPYYYPNESERGALTILYNGSENSNVIVRDWMKLSNLRLEDKLLYTHIESEIKELISGLTVTLYSNISDYDTDERIFEFDMMSKFTMPTSATVNISFVIGYNKETQVSISNSSGEEIASRTITKLSDSMSVQLGSGVFTLTMTSRIYMPDGVDITSMSEAQEWVNNRISASAKYTTESKSYWSINGTVVFLENYGIELADGLTPSNGDYISIRQDNYIQPSDKLLPPIYRETNGKERFYEAKNNTYINPQTGTYYRFNNEFVEGNPKEHIVSFEDIKPTIKNMTNSLGQRIDMFQEFAYDLNDNDETYPEGSDKAGEYIHPYFFAKLRKFDGDYGFNLFDHAIDEDEMTISMTSGNCGACEWVIGVDEDTQKNIVQVDENGNILRDDNGNVKLGEPQDRQNDTQNNEVWIALKKDINTFGVVMPNATYNYKPSVNDTFVILHIDLPKAYVLAAENRLKEELIKYMAENNDEKFNFSISFSRIFFAENPDILADLNENARLRVEYDGTIYDLYVSSYSYKMSNDTPLPEIQVELSDTLTISQNALQTSIDKVEQDIMRNLDSIDWLKVGLKYFIRKDKDDNTSYSLSIGKNLSIKGLLTAMGNAILQSAATVWGLLTAQGGLVVQKFLKIGDFVSGLTGGYIDEKGDAELNSLILRDHLSVPEVRYNRITYFEGYNLISPGGGLKIEDYTINDGGSITVTPRLEEGEPCGQFVDDFLLGYYHNKTATGDFAGFQKVQFIVTSVDYDAKTFVMRPRDPNNYKIAKNMVLGQTGNLSNPERQTYTVIDTRDGNNCITFYDHVNEFDPKSAHEMAWFGKKKGRTVNGIDATSYSAVLKNIIMTGRIFQVDSITGEDIRVPIDKGAYVKGQQYAYYDRVTHLGSLWLCISEAGTTQEPSATEPAWLEEVKAGKSITSYAHWDASQTPYPVNASLTFANRLWISNKETSEPPLGLVKAGGAYVKYHDENGNEGYVLRHPETQSEDWNLWFDFSGIKDGESIDVQYSSDTVSWHATFTTGDLYMRQRKGDGQWSEAMRIVGEKGQDGPYQDYEFAKSKSIDTQPTTGWQDAPPSIAEDEFLWMRTGWVVPPKTTPDAWAVVRLSGPKGKDGESPYLADLDNEMDSIPLSSEGKTTQSWTLTTTAALYYGQTRLTLTSITTNAASPITASVNASTGVVTFTVSSGQAVPERSAISITIKAPNGSELVERTLIYTLAGVKAGAKGATGAAGANGSDGADAVIYRLLTSVSSVVRKKDGSYSVSSVSCRRMKRIGNGAEAVTTEGTLKRSIDGGSESVIANDATTATTAFTKNIKYLFYDGSGTLVDVETIPLVADGTDGTNGTNGTNGKDGVSITNLGHWNTALGTVPQMSLVTMGGRSWLSKVATANPPLGTLTTASGRRITVKTQGGQVVYALSGRVNSAEWELLTEDSRSLSLVPTISSLQQTKLGWLNPSGYLVRACQQVGSVNLPITKYYLTTWAISSTGVKTRIISPTVTGEQAVSASKGYTQFITRMYSNYTDAYNWTDNHMAECTVGVVADGADGTNGADGRTGSEPRPRGVFKPGNTYEWNETYHDIIVWNGHVFMVKNYGASVKEAPTSPDGDTNWKPAQEFEFVATDLLLSRQIKAEEIDVDSLWVKNLEAKSSDGKTTAKIDGATGKFTAKNAEVDGLNATNAVIDGEMTVKTLKRKMLKSADYILNGSISVFVGSSYMLPYLGLGECVEVKILSVSATKVFNACSVMCSGQSVKLYVGNTITSAKYARAMFTVDVDLIGFRYDGQEGFDSNITYWRIMPIGTTDTSGIEITSL